MLGHRMRMLSPPRGVSDNFNRANTTVGSGLGYTSDGSGQQWQILQGSWGINNNQAYTNTGPANWPIAYIQTSFTDVDITVSTNGGSYGGGDAIYFRIVDGNNWYRLKTIETNYVVTTYCGSTYVSCQCPGNCCVYDCCVSMGYTQGTGCGGCSQPLCTGYCFSTSQNSQVYCATACSGCTVYGSACSYACGSTTYINNNVILEKNVAGTRTTLANYTVNTGANSVLMTSLHVRAVGSSIQAAWNGGALQTAVTDSSISSTKHGIGRAEGSNQDAQGLDNFVCNAYPS